MSASFAIVGSGPSGMYAADALLKEVPGCRVDVFDRLPTPYGLVRGGVAPDHQKIKSVIRVYEKIAANPAVRLRMKGVLYDLRAERVTQAAEIAGFGQAWMDQSIFRRDPAGLDPVWIYRLVSR